jgi:arylsulfatase A-like enzyme
MMPVRSLALLLLIVAIVNIAASAQPAARPNVIVIVADDLGNGDLGVQGCKDIPTPNVDSIARNGVRFTNGYVSCPVCSPTRAGLLTGRYQTRFGHEFNPGPAAAPTFGLPQTESTIADAFKAAGYSTALVGKWHEGNKPELRPNKRGFDEFYGFLGGAHAYLPKAQLPGGAADAAAADPAAAFLPNIFRNDKTYEEKEYLTDAFAREAVAYLDRHGAGKEPFLLYLAFNAVHMPAHATQKYLDRFPNLEGKRKTYAAQLSALDDAVGQVLARLREQKQEENTLIFFISDNGGPIPNGSNNGIFRGTKGTVFEGGIRVPFFAQWKGKIPAGQTREDLVCSIDLFPTALAAAGIAPSADKKFDGVNLLPAALGQPGAKTHDQLAWRFGPQWALRSGKWKLFQARGDTAPRLFDLSTDAHEDNDLAAANPEIVKQLRADYDAWNKQNIDPLWKTQGRGGGQANRKVNPNAK